MDDEDLAGLIEQAKAGDEFALRDLLSRCEEDVRMVVRARLPRALRSQFDSMDFVQAVWQSVFTGPDRDLGRFENVRHLRGFLAGVAQNKVFEEHRRRTRTQKYDLGARSRSSSVAAIATCCARCRRPSPRRARTPRPGTGSTR